MSLFRKSSPPSAAAHLALGRKGEEEAVRYLQQNGYRILACNLKAKFGEIDVVAENGPALCFVEIKARSSARFGLPEEAVHPMKRRQLVRLASWYLQRLRGKTYAEVRFDVLSILTGPAGDPPYRIRLIKAAFEAA